MKKCKKCGQRIRFLKDSYIYDAQEKAYYHFWCYFDKVE